MKIVLQPIIRIDSEVVAVVGHFVRVHHWGWNFDWTAEVEIVVAHRICELLDDPLRKFAVVLRNDVVDWSGSGNRGGVGNHVEVEFLPFIIMLDKCGVDNSSGRRIQHSCSVLLHFEEPRVDFLVYKDVKNLWLIARFVGLDRLGNQFNLCFFNFFLHWRPANTVSVDNNLVRQLLVVVLFVVG